MPWPPDPIPQLKRDAAATIVALIAGDNAIEIGEYLGIGQPRISDLRRGKLERFSLERLIRLLERLGQRVTLQIERKPPRRSERPPPR